MVPHADTRGKLPFSTTRFLLITSSFHSMTSPVMDSVRTSLRGSSPAALKSLRTKDVSACCVSRPLGRIARLELGLALSNLKGLESKMLPSAAVQHFSISSSSVKLNRRERRKLAHRPTRQTGFDVSQAKWRIDMACTQQHCAQWLFPAQRPTARALFKQITPQSKIMPMPPAKSLLGASLSPALHDSDSRRTRQRRC